MNGGPVQAYIEGVARRLQADGCTVTTENWQGTPVLVGYRSDFRMRWIATKLHLLTVVAAVPTVTRPVLEGFTGTALDYAIDRKGEWRGFQSGVAVLPALVSGFVDEPAARWAAEKQRLRFAVLGRPVAVDVTRRTATAFRGTPTLGIVYAGHLRSKLATYFPEPF